MKRHVCLQKGNRLEQWNKKWIQLQAILWFSNHYEDKINWNIYKNIDNL